jgi:hypothetical protein
MSCDFREDDMSRRSAIVIGLASACVAALGAQTATPPCDTAV